MQHRSAEAARAFFVGQLRSLFNDDQLDADLRLQIDSFLASLDAFLDLLLIVANLPAGEEVRDAFANGLRATDRIFLSVVSRGLYHFDTEINVVCQGNGAQRNVYPLW